MRSRLVTATCSRPALMIKSPLGRSRLRNSSTVTTVPLFCFVRFTSSLDMLNSDHENYITLPDSRRIHRSTTSNANLQSRRQSEQVHGLSLIHISEPTRL